MILDEPTSAMDAQGKRNFIALLEETKGTRTVIFTTQFTKEATKLADRVCIVAAGNIKCSGLFLVFRAEILLLWYKEAFEASTDDVLPIQLYFTHYELNSRPLKSRMNEILLMSKN